jgi:hypothetical protein
MTSAVFSCVHYSHRHYYKVDGSPPWTQLAPPFYYEEMGGGKVQPEVLIFTAALFYKNDWRCV